LRDTTIDEIADGVFRISTFVAEVAPPAGFVFNQFLILDEEPFLFHCGQRMLFPKVSEAVAKVVPLKKLRWIGFGHVEADECGAMNLWLAAAPNAQIAHGMIACGVSLNDLADRPPRALADGEVIATGEKRMRYIDTAHVPHGWEAGIFYEETAKTLFCGDLFTHVGDGPALVRSEILGPAAAAEDVFHATSIGPSTGVVIRKLAQLAPRTLALMHGSSFAGDCAGQLNGLGRYYDDALRKAVAGQ